MSLFVALAQFITQTHAAHGVVAFGGDSDDGGGSDCALIHLFIIQIKARTSVDLQKEIINFPLLFIIVHFIFQQISVNFTLGAFYEMVKQTPMLGGVNRTLFIRINKTN